MYPLPEGRNTSDAVLSSVYPLYASSNLLGGLLYSEKMRPAICRNAGQRLAQLDSVGLSSVLLLGFSNGISSIRLLAPLK